MNFFGTANELKLLFGAIVLGALLGAAYDILRALRLTVRHGSAAVFFEDTVFALLVGLCFYTYCTALCRGELRGFVLAGMAAGFFAYLVTLGRLVSKGVAFFVGRAKKLTVFIVRMFKKAALNLFGMTYFGKIAVKFRKKPCQSKNIDV